MLCWLNIKLSTKKLQLTQREKILRNESTKMRKSTLMIYKMWSYNIIYVILTLFPMRIMFWMCYVKERKITVYKP